MRSKKQSNMESNSNQEKMYVFDLENIMNFVFDKEKTKKNNIEITENYDNVSVEDGKNVMKLVSKTIKETKGDNPSVPNQDNNIRYDLIKYFISTLEELPPMITDDALTFGDKVILNTMVNEGLLKLAEQ